ncbi:unnamed protein product [Nesidiocoris tenuis]|uniref:Uncharacterized protein n=1 Tax=Nesidiocoris tenuis TaxID=355587 RepID=A0A6H5HGK3_9HEMI|nr:unnamed protein product [Nesidiocoris tenuis]
MSEELCKFCTGAREHRGLCRAQPPRRVRFLNVRHSEARRPRPDTPPTAQTAAPTVEDSIVESSGPAMTVPPHH